MRTTTARILVTALFAGALLGCASGNGKSFWQGFDPPSVPGSGPVVAGGGSAPCSGAQIITVVSGGNCSSPGASPGGSPSAQTGLAATPPPLSVGGAGTGNAGPQGSCGSGTDGTYDLVYTSSLSRWCVLDSAWQASGVAAYTPFFAFGDAVVTALNTDFGYTPKGLPFTFEAGPNNGSAHTPGDFGLSDEFPDPSAASTDGGVSHFYGYLLPLHEAINTWTGSIAGSWPTDWWADHRSPFPNSMDAFFLKAIGDATNNATLQQAAIHQTSRFDCVGGDGCDKEVVLFNTFFTNYGGFMGFANAFKFLLGDGIRLGNVSPNPSPLLTEYVAAYLQLGFGSSTDLTPMFVNAGVGTLDTMTPAYTVDPTVVLAVANAHCAIKAGGTSANPALQALQHGNYQSATATGGTQAACPAECIWSVPKNVCSAKW
jgi:hypothetical protein